MSGGMALSRTSLHISGGVIIGYGSLSWRPGSSGGVTRFTGLRMPDLMLRQNLPVMPG